MTRPADQKLGLYLHWPYCTRICPYCDFNVYKNREVDMAAWRRVLTEDLRYWAERRPGKLTSLYFGGGTPSLMPPALAAYLVEECARLWGFEEGAEITLEANPTDAEMKALAAFAEAGVTRLSLGVQSLRDGSLIFLGRNHDAAESRRAIDLGRSLFREMTFDLIYARPDHDLAGWQAELEEAIATGITHLSLYQLTIEPGTAFERAVMREEWDVPDSDAQADFYETTQEICNAAGLLPYEVSNYACTGHEALHNKLYWQSQEWIGIGPGAHGRVMLQGQRHTTQTPLRPAAYLTAPVEERFKAEVLSQEDQLTEFLSMGLRLAEGVEKERYAKLAGGVLPGQVISQLAGDGLLAETRTHIALTRMGRNLLDSVVLALMR
jgi:oxygen-independent coproporphyrinogen-3 oxidase